MLVSTDPLTLAGSLANQQSHVSNTTEGHESGNLPTQEKLCWIDLRTETLKGTWFSSFNRACERTNHSQRLPQSVCKQQNLGRTLPEPASCSHSGVDLRGPKSVPRWPHWNTFCAIIDHVSFHNFELCLQHNSFLEKKSICPFVFQFCHTCYFKIVLSVVL